jgi:hypothetical protein
MSNSTFAPFSMMGKEQRAKIDKAIDASLIVMHSVLDAPMAAKENLIRTDFKAACSMLAFVGRILQSESAMAQAIAVVADRASTSEKFRETIAENFPEFKLPPKKLKV